MPPDWLVVIDRRVRTVRRRWLAAQLVRAFVVAFGVGAVSALAIQLASLFATTVLHPPFVGAMVGIGVWIVAAASALLRAPDLATSARRIDAEVGALQQFSTAREVVRGETPGSGGAVAQALVERAVALAEQVDPVRIAPFFLDRAARSLLVVGCLCVVMLLALPVLNQEAATHGARSSPDDVELDPTERSTAQAELEGLAQAVSLEAERLRDPYLDALAAGARDLARRIGESGASDLTTAGQLNTLVNHLEEALASRITGASGTSEGDETANSTGPDGVGKPAARESALTEALERALSLRSDLERVQAARGGDVMGSLYTDPRALQAQTDALRAAAAQRGPPGGAPVGAAARSNEGAGDVAGEGAHALFGDGEAEVSDASRREEVALPEAAGRRQGERVMVTGDSSRSASERPLAATGSSTNGNPGGTLATVSNAGAERREEAGGWRRSHLDPRARDLASRLFSPIGAE